MEITYDGGGVARISDPDGLVPTSATVGLWIDGLLVASPSVTISAVATTVAAGTTPSVVKLASATGFAVGDRVAVVVGGQTIVVEIAALSTVYATLTGALPEVPATGAAVTRLLMSATIAAPGETYLGRGAYLLWDYSGSGWSRRRRDEVEIVRSPWIDPVSSTDVRDDLQQIHQIRTPSDALCARIAMAANDRLRSAIYTTGRRPALYFGPTAFAAAGRAARDWAIASQGYGGGKDSMILEAKRRDMDRMIGEAISSVRAYDSADSGTPDAVSQLSSARVYL